VPLNQAIMLATLMDFTVVTWSAMERMGVELSPEDRRAHLYTWSIIGALMGVDACQEGALSLEDADLLSKALRSQLGQTDGGRLLMGALLSELERMMPLGLRKLPRSLVRWLFEEAPDGVRLVPDMLGVPPSAWWSTPVFNGLRSVRRAPLPRPIESAADRLAQRAGRIVFTGFADGWVTEAPPFRIPQELMSSWHIRSGSISTGVRATRQRNRQRVRATVGRRTRRRSGGPSRH
jgi:hypothetical protein